jgi:hypothetical protein
MVLQGSEGVVVGPHRGGDSPSRPAGAPSTTFFPKKYDSAEYGGCGATDFTGGRCPQETGR